MTRRFLLPLLALIGFAVPLSIAIRRPATEPEAAPAPRRSEAPPEPPAPPAPAASPSAPTEAPKTGRLRGRVLLPAGAELFEYSIYVFDSSGDVEQREVFRDSDSFELASLGFGKRAVVLFCPRGELRTVVQVLTIPEQGAAEVELRTSPAPRVQGRVGDASGKGVGGLEVEWREALDFGDFLQKPLTGPEHGVAGGGGSYTRSSGKSYSWSLRPYAAEVSRSVSIDAEGRFGFPLPEERAPVTLRIRRGLELVKEELVLPQNAPFQILIPLLPPPAKK